MAYSQANGGSARQTRRNIPSIRAMLATTYGDGRRVVPVRARAVKPLLDAGVKFYAARAITRRAAWIPLHRRARYYTFDAQIRRAASLRRRVQFFALDSGIGQATHFSIASLRIEGRMKSGSFITDLHLRRYARSSAARRSTRARAHRAPVASPRGHEHVYYGRRRTS